MNFIQFEQKDGVATIILNRPEVLNSFNRAMAKELQNALKTVSEDGSIRAILLTASGKAFCAGQDLAEIVDKNGVPSGDLGEIVHDSYNPIIRAIREIEKPFVCAVNGVAAGAGANLALACDIVIAAKEASFIQAFSKIGLIPDSGGTFLLPRIVGMARATALTFLGEKVNAEQAVAMGLIYKTTESATLKEDALKIANTLASMPTRGFGLTKRAFNSAAINDLRTQLDLEEELQREAGKTHDYKEGVMAFLGKRPAQFKGC